MELWAYWLLWYCPFVVHGHVATRGISDHLVQKQHLIRADCFLIKCTPESSRPFDFLKCTVNHRLGCECPPGQAFQPQVLNYKSGHARVRRSVEVPGKPLDFEPCLECRWVGSDVAQLQQLRKRRYSVRRLQRRCCRRMFYRGHSEGQPVACILGAGRY